MESIPFSSDWTELLATFNAAGVRYLGLLVERTHENARCVFGALLGFGAPLEVDIITEISGVLFEDAWQSRDDGTLGGVPVSFIGREAFLLNKRSTGRIRDMADAEAVEKESEALISSMRFPNGSVM